MHLRLSFGKNRDFTRPGTSRAPPAPRRTRPGEVRAGLTRPRPDTVPLSAGKDALCSSVSTQKSGLSLQNLPLVPPTPSRGKGRARCAPSRQEPRSCPPLFGDQRRTWPSGGLFLGGFQPDFTRPSLLSLPQALGAARGVPGMLSACQHAPHRPSPPADALLRGCPNPGTPRPRCPRRDEPHQGPLLPARTQPSDFCHPLHPSPSSPASPRAPPAVLE